MYLNFVSLLVILYNSICVFIARHFRAAMEASFWIICICHIER